MVYGCRGEDGGIYFSNASWPSKFGAYWMWRMSEQLLEACRMPGPLSSRSCKQRRIRNYWWSLFFGNYAMNKILLGRRDVSRVQRLWLGASAFMPKKSLIWRRGAMRQLDGDRWDGLNPQRVCWSWTMMLLLFRDRTRGAGGLLFETATTMLYSRKRGKLNICWMLFMQRWLLASRDWSFDFGDRHSRGGTSYQNRQVLRHSCRSSASRDKGSGEL